MRIKRYVIRSGIFVKYFRPGSERLVTLNALEQNKKKALANPLYFPQVFEFPDFSSVFIAFECIIYAFKRTLTDWNNLSIHK